MINQFNPCIHAGLQPIRVLALNIVESFSKVYPDFNEESKLHEKLYSLSPAIQCYLDEEPLNSENVELTPYIEEDDKGIKRIFYFGNLFIL